MDQIKSGQKSTQNVLSHMRTLTHTHTHTPLHTRTRALAYAIIASPRMRGTGFRWFLKNEKWLRSLFDRDS